MHELRDGPKENTACNSITTIATRKYSHSILLNATEGDVELKNSVLARAVKAATIEYPTTRLAVRDRQAYTPPAD